MATRAKFARLARYSRKFVEASHIFLENGLWRVLASLASPRNTARRVSESGESAQHGLANVGKSGESAQHGSANVGGSGESPQHGSAQARMIR